MLYIASQHLWRNRLQTVLLIMLLLAISSVVAGLIFGEIGLWLALSGAVLMMFLEPVAAWRMTLRLYQARPIHPSEAPEIWRVVTVLAQRAELPAIPSLYYVPSSMLNAFTVGQGSNSAIALTDGLLRQLTLRELAGVLGHEIAHIAHGDLWVMGFADYISRLTNVFSVAGQLMLFISLPILMLEGYGVEINWLSIFLLLFSPHLAVLAQLGLSRVREYNADQKSANLTGDPMGLAYALARIERSGRSWMGVLLPGWGNPQPSWLRSHPPTEERIKRLQEIANTSMYFGLPLEPDLPVGFIATTIQRLPRWRIGGFWY